MGLCVTVVCVGGPTWACVCLLYCMCRRPHVGLCVTVVCVGGPTWACVCLLYV